jgi:hypothetical protein
MTEESRATLMRFVFSHGSRSHVIAVLILCLYLWLPHLIDLCHARPPPDPRHPLNPTHRVHISSSALCRHIAESDRHDAESVRQLMDAGDLVPDDIVNAAMRHRLEQVDVRQTGFVLDGFPRTEAQAALLIAMKLVPSRVVVLACPDQVIEDRLAGMRIDTETQQVYCTRGGDIALAPPANVHHRLTPVVVKPKVRFAVRCCALLCSAVLLADLCIVYNFCPCIHVTPLFPVHMSLSTRNSSRVILVVIFVLC